MYEVVQNTPKEIITIYIIFLAACLITYPVVKLIVGAITKGVSKWT